MATPKVTIIVVNYNSGTLLARCVNALEKQTVRDFEVIVIDNASVDASLECLRVADGRFRLVRLSSNVGFAAGNNHGMRIARSDWIATLNPDAFPDPMWLEVALSAIASNPDVRIIGSTQINADNDQLFDGLGDCYHALGIPWRGGYGQTRTHGAIDGEVFGPCAAAAFYHASTLKELEGFDESFFCYCEDVDLAFRFRLLGHRCLQLANARVYHCGSAISGKHSHFTIYHSARNRVWVFLKNMPAALLFLLLPAHLFATVYLLYRHRKSDVFRPQMLGFLAALKGIAKPLRSRRQIQRARRASAWRIAKAFTWSLEKMRRREADIRPWVGLK